MAITPINVHRVSHNMFTLSLLDSLRSNTLDLFLEQNRLASGNKLNAPSEDPVEAFRAMEVSAILDQQAQILQNIDHADSLLSATDSALGEINGLLIDAHDIALGMINSTTSTEERQAEAQLVRGILDQLVTIGNRRYRDLYLFGGQQVTTAPFTQTYGVAEYRGDVGSLNVHVDRSQDPAVNLTGAELFNALGVFSGWVDLDPALQLDTRLADMGGTTGRGIQTGSIQITLSEPSASFTVDLGGADSAGDIISLIEDAARNAGLTVGAGQDLAVGFNAAGNGFRLDVTSGTVTVEELGDGVTARDLGLLGSGGSLEGDDVNTRLVPMTRIDTLFGNAGATLGTIRLENGHLTADVDLADATTIQDVINRINAAGVEVRAQINEAGTGLDVVNLVSGFEMRISEVDGNTATVLGIRSYHAGTLLSEMNDGRGVPTVPGSADLIVQAKDGTRFEVNLDDARTVQDVIDAINAAAAAAGTAVSASLATTGNGIRLVDETGGGGAFSVERANMSYAIDALGLDHSTDGTELVSDDTNGIVPDSIFTALHNLYEGLVDNDDVMITDAAQRLESFMNRTSRLAGEVGARSSAMKTRLQFTEDAVVATQALLSKIKDLDYSEAVTRFQQAQTALQANLMTGSRLMELSLLNFIR